MPPPTLALKVPPTTRPFFLESDIKAKVRELFDQLLAKSCGVESALGGGLLWAVGDAVVEDVPDSDQ